MGLGQPQEGRSQVGRWWMRPKRPRKVQLGKVADRTSAVTKAWMVAGGQSVDRTAADETRTTTDEMIAHGATEDEDGASVTAQRQR